MQTALQLAASLKEAVNSRHFFVAPAGYVWASSDFSSQEFRIAGAISSDEKILAIYLLEKDYDTGRKKKPLDPTGKDYSDPAVDPHIVAGCSLDSRVKRLFDVEPWQCNKKNPLVNSVRDDGKVLNYQLIFGGSANSVSIKINRSPEEAQEMIDKYFSYPDGFWGLGNWLKATAAVAAETSWVRTAMNGFMFVNESNAKGLSDAGTVLRKAVNTRIQGSASEQSKLAAILAEEALDKLNEKYSRILNGRQGYLLNIVHDI